MTQNRHADIPDPKKAKVQDALQAQEEPKAKADEGENETTKAPKVIMSQKKTKRT
jgi:hypothetical protein